MNIKEYESAIDPVMESYDSDDIILGDIHNNENDYESGMNVLLEALDMLPEAEFVATMESMTDDEIYAIYDAALESKNNPKPPKPTDDAMGASDEYKERIAGTTGGVLNKITSYLSKKGETTLTSDMQKKIADAGKTTGKANVYELAQLMHEGKLSKDQALQQLKTNADYQAKGIRKDLWQSGVRNPLAYFAADRKFRNAAATAYKDRADEALKKKLADDAKKEAKKKQDEALKKKNPEEYESIKQKEKLAKQDESANKYRNSLSDTEKAEFDTYRKNVERDRLQSKLMDSTKKAYNDALAAGFSEKQAKKFANVDKTKRQIEFNNHMSALADNARNIKDTLKEETPTLQAAGKNIAKGGKKLAKGIKAGAKAVWDVIKSDTGSEYGFEYYTGEDIDVALESIYEFGNTIYTSAFEEAYYAARVIASMNEDEVDEMMSAMSATECVELINSLNFFNDVIDADIRRTSELRFEGTVENVFQYNMIDYAMEDSTDSAPVQSDEKKDPPAPATNSKDNPPNNNNKMTIGGRLDSFINRAKGAFGKAREWIRNWHAKRAGVTTPVASNNTNNNNNNSGDNNNTDKSDSGDNNGSGG